MLSTPTNYTSINGDNFILFSYEPNDKKNIFETKDENFLNSFNDILNKLNLYKVRVGSEDLNKRNKKIPSIEEKKSKNSSYYFKEKESEKDSSFNFKEEKPQDSSFYFKQAENFQNLIININSNLMALAKSLYNSLAEA